MNFFEITAYAHPADEIYEGQPAKIGAVEVNPNIYHTHKGGDLVSMITMALPFLIILVLLYMVLIRPQRRKDREDKKAVERMKVGDVASTTGGVSGLVTDIEGGYVSLAVGLRGGEYEEPVIRVARESIRSIEKKGEEFTPVIAA